mgnify:CR=1 FL=1|jgi:hypothetical protein
MGETWGKAVFIEGITRYQPNGVCVEDQAYCLWSETALLVSCIQRIGIHILYVSYIVCFICCRSRTAILDRN